MQYTPNPAPLLPPANDLWFKEARYGMFIHWGLYALLGREAWAMSRERWPLEEYQKLAEDFTASAYDPKAWAQLAVDAGMKYMVLTSKHHEGFCLWDSKLCPYNAVNFGAKRDLLAEYVDAVRAAGLKVGLYYSLGDWFHPDWFKGFQGDKDACDRFMAYTHGLIRELMTGYGKIDILWYDLPQAYSVRQWRSVDLNAMVRELQPGILINNRALTTEDFATPEQHATKSDPYRLWESCMTLNQSWGYCPGDKNYKSPRTVALTLAGIAADEGNLLLNVGPDGEGRIPEKSKETLLKVGVWLKTHGECVYGTNRHNLSWNLWGNTSVSGNNMYLHLERYPGTQLIIGGLENQVLKASLLGDESALSVTKKGLQTIISGLPSEDPSEVLSVLKLEVDGVPKLDNSTYIGRADLSPVFPK